jgi:hypothetical protein
MLVNHENVRFMIYLCTRMVVMATTGQVLLSKFRQQDIIKLSMPLNLYAVMSLGPVPIAWTLSLLVFLS